MTSRADWAAALTAAMAWQPGVRDGIVAQAYSEGSQAHWNPLDTTQPWPGSWPYNTVGVQNYRTMADGIAATKATLLNGHYPQALAAGQAGDSSAYVDAIASEPWGTWSTTADAQAALSAVRSDPTIAAITIAGSSEEDAMAVSTEVVVIDGTTYLNIIQEKSDESVVRYFKALNGPNAGVPWQHEAVS